MAAGAVAVAGAAFGGWALAAHLSSGGGQRAAPEQLAPAAATRQTPRGSTPSQVSTSPSASQAGTVTIAPAAAQDPDSTSVAEFLSQYFGAINNRDYRTFSSLLSPQVQITAAEFASGYRTTSDTAQTLTGISAAANGDLAADVTFTSHQAPADSADGTESCTNWSISLFLERSGDGYLLDQPPAGYHAHYGPC